MTRKSGILITAASLLCAASVSSVAAAEGSMPHGGGNELTHRMMVLMLQLGVILFVARLGGALSGQLRMPPVLGELCAGLLIGPFLLGGVPLPGFPHGLFDVPPEVGIAGIPVSPELYGIGTLAAVVLLFLVGLETDLKLFLRYSLVGGLVGMGGVGLSFIAGNLLTVALSPWLVGRIMLGFGVLYFTVGMAAKLIGCGLPPMLAGFTLRGGLRIGAGMVPRAEVTLLMAGTALAAGVLTPELLGIVVVMTLLSVLAAPPLILWAFSGSEIIFSCQQREIAFVHTAMIEVLASLEQTVRELRKPLDARKIQRGLQTAFCTGEPPSRAQIVLRDALGHGMLNPRLRSDTREGVLRNSSTNWLPPASCWIVRALCKPCWNGSGIWRPAWNTASRSPMPAPQALANPPPPCGPPSRVPPADATRANVWQRGRGFRAVPPVRGPQRARPDTPQLAASYQPVGVSLGVVPEGQPE